MQEDFHYYATYCAAYLAGYSHEESMDISYSAQFVDCCSKTLLSKIKGPKSAATTQTQTELGNISMDLINLQDITRIWASFHFLPYDLYAKRSKRPRRYLHKYRLICKPNGDLVSDTVERAREGTLQAVGIAMHVLADTWAHSYFAGTPTLIINNTDGSFRELLMENGVQVERKVRFRHNPTAPDDLEKGVYSNSVFQSKENSIMNLGHGRAGHLPDYSFIRYQYLPAWGDYHVILKDNPSEYYYAFCQMVYAMRYIRGIYDSFQKRFYDEDFISPWKDEITRILTKRQLNACGDWKAFGQQLSGMEIENFEISKYQNQYMTAPKEKKDDTFLGRFLIAAMAQKSMVTNRIFKSGNPLAGISIDYNRKGFAGIKDFKKLVDLKGSL